MKNIEDYRGKKYAIHCKSKNEWDFITQLIKYKWDTGKWSTYLDKSIIYTNSQQYGTVSTALQYSYTILEAKDFMEEENKLPEFWCIKITQENLELVGAYYDRKGGCTYRNTNYIGSYYTSHNLSNGRSVMNDSISYGANFILKTKKDTYTEISTETFKQHVLKQDNKPMEKPKYFVVKRDANNPLWDDYIAWMNKTYNKTLKGTWDNYYGYDGVVVDTSNLNYLSNNPKVLELSEWKSIFIDNNNQTMNKTVKKSEFKKVHDVACPTWQTKCKEYASKDPFSDTIEFTEAQIEEMFNAARTDQKPVLEEVFGKREVQFNSGMLNQGEVMEITENSKYNYAIRTLTGFILIDNTRKEHSIYTGNSTYNGKKLPSGTKIEIIAK